MNGYKHKFQLLNASETLSLNDVLLSELKENSLHENAEKAIETVRKAKFGLGDRVKHRVFPFRGVVMDIDFSFNNTEEWYQSIPHHLRPKKDQPFYHLLAENEDKTVYFAYVSEQNLIRDSSQDDIDKVEMSRYFDGNSDEGYRPRSTFH